MAADATAAAYLQGAQKNVDPMGMYAAGVQLRSSLQKVDLAAQAQTTSTILDLLRVQNERSSQEQRNKLAEQQLALAAYDSETRRIAATRPRVGRSATSSGGGATPQFMDMGDGSFEITVPGPQGPTDGQGDGNEVLDLREGPDNPSLMGIGGSMSQTAPGMGGPSMPGGPAAAVGAAQPQQATGSHIPGLADPFGTPEPSPQPTPGAAAPGAAPAKKGRYGPPSVSVSGTGRVSYSFKPLEASDTDAPVMPAPPEVLQQVNAVYDGFNKVAVPTNDKAYPLGYKFEDKPQLHGKSISDLSADEQKRFSELAREVVGMSQGLRKSTPEAKMAAMGVSDPALMTDEMWAEGFRRVQADPNNPVDPVAVRSLMTKATELAGFKNLMLDTNVHRPETIIEQMGVDIRGMFPTQQGAAAGVSVAGAGQDTVATKGGAAPAAAPAAAGAKPSARESAAAGATVSIKPPAADTDPWTMPAKQPDAKPTPPPNPAREAANQKWESNKMQVVRALKSTLTQEEIDDLRKDDIPDQQGIDLGGKSADYKRQQWVEKNASRLGIKPKEGKEVTLDSVIFVDHDGRSIKLREVLESVFTDVRFNKNRPTEMKTKGGNDVNVSLGTLKEVE